MDKEVIVVAVVAYRREWLVKLRHHVGNVRKQRQEAINGSGRDAGGEPLLRRDLVSNLSEDSLADKHRVATGEPTPDDDRWRSSSGRVEEIADKDVGIKKRTHSADQRRSRSKTSFPSAA